jgi:IAA-amino acid hydrolase
MREFLRHARSFHADLVALRRDLHRHPELAFREHRTAAAAAAALRGLGLEPRTGIGGTGVVAELRAGDGPTVALRADMDALPIAESNPVEYRSTHPGVMHACGHDAHTAMLVGAARLLAGAAVDGNLPAGTVRFLFQPAEEQADDDNRSGAAHLVAAGVMEGVDSVFALHVGPHLPSGRMFTAAGPLMAGSDRFTARVLGSASHGARPDAGVDAVVLAAHAVLAAQNAVARRIPPLEAGVLTIGLIEGGTAENIVAERVSLGGTLRYFHPDVRRRLWESLEQALQVADALGGGHELDLREGYPPTVNDPAMAGLAMDAARELLGPEGAEQAEPMLAAEDFSLLLREAPGAFLWLGAAPPDAPRELHRPDMDIDESALPVGAAVLAACAARALAAR